MSAREGVWMPPIKEIDFFCGPILKEGNLKTIRRGRSEKPKSIRPDKRDHAFLRIYAQAAAHLGDIDWYRRLFDCKLSDVSGDVSPNYAKLKFKDIEVLSNSLPTACFVMLVREPISRLWSYLCMLARKNRLSEQDIISLETLELLLTNGSIRRNSFSSRIWNDWSRVIPAERIRFWLFDDICDAPLQVLNELSEFLSIAPGPGLLPPSYNRKEGKAKTTIPMDVHKRLLDHFEEEHHACAEVFGGRATFWRSEAIKRMTSQ
jgi:hypothetical protein